MTSTTALQAFRSPNFALLWTAQAISAFGDRITVFALAYVTWELTRSAISTTLAVVVSTLPYAIFGFFGGAIADSFGRRRVMVVCDVVRMIAIGLVPASIMLGAPLAIAYVLVLVAEICSAVFIPARSALLPDVVPPHQLGASNSMIFASDRTVEVVGTLLAGVLVALLGTSAFYVDALTFLVSAALLSRIAVAEPPARAVPVKVLLRDALDGLNVIRDQAVLRANTIFSLLAQLALPIVNGLAPVLVFREFGLGPEAFGVTEAAIAAGSVAAGVLFPTVLGRARKGRTMVGGFAALGILLIVMGATPSFAVVVVLFALIGVTNVVFFVPNMTLIQQLAPAESRARVFGVRFALLNLTWLPAILVSASLAEALSVQVIFAAAGVFTLGVAVAGALIPIVRDAD